MQIWDISMTIRPDMQVYKDRDEKRPAIQTVKSFDTDTMQESRIHFDLHTGTHMDAPLHMLKGGETIEYADLKKLITPCRVIDVTSVSDRIKDDDLRDFSIQSGDFILLKTRNSFSEAFDPGFVFLDATGARYLQERGIAGVGIDALGIERDQPGHPTHKHLLGSGIIILEGLRLSEVPAGSYKLIALPLKLSGAEASPVRAVLLDET